MTTHSKPCARADFLFRRGGDMTVGVRWRQDAGNGYEPVDMTGYEATFHLEDNFGWSLLEVACTCTSDGYAMALVSADTWESDALAGVTKGSWRIVAERDGAPRVIGIGYWEVR